MAKRKAFSIIEECSSDKLRCTVNKLSESLDNELERRKLKETVKLWLEIFPDGEPEYFYKKYIELKDNGDEIEPFVTEKLVKGNYPKLKDKRMCAIDNAEKNFYIKEFSVEKFLKRFPEPIKYFLDKNRVSLLSREECLSYVNQR